MFRIATILLPVPWLQILQCQSNEVTTLGFELSEFDVWTSASPHFVNSTLWIGKSEDNDISVGFIEQSKLMQKGPMAADHVVSNPTRSRPWNLKSASLTSGFNESPFC